MAKEQQKQQKGGGKGGGQQPQQQPKKEKKGAEAPAAAATGVRPGKPEQKPRMQRYYEETVRAKLQQEFGFTSSMQIPKLEKITVNVGLGEAPKNPKLLEGVVSELAAITGQKPVVNRAKKAISNFSLRQGQPIGASVTLRRERMWEFFDRLVNVAMPRIRDFRGVPSRSFDGRGNYTIGIKEQLIFPEIDYDKVEKIHGMDITFVTSTSKDDQALALLRELGMPFRGESPVQVGQAA